MAAREASTGFLTAEEILSNAKDSKFIRWLRESHARGKLRIRCKSLQEHHAIFQILLTGIRPGDSAKAR